MATIVDSTTPAPDQNGRLPITLLPFPLLPPNDQLAADVLPYGQGTIYRSGSITAHAMGGTITAVYVHRVRLTHSDTQHLWRVLSAAAREGAGLMPGEVPHGFIVPPPAQPLSAGPIHDDRACEEGEYPLIIGTRFRSGTTSMIVQHAPERRGWLRTFGTTGLDPAAVIRDLPDALAIIGVAF
ncbi:MAG: hypothetical protein OHK0022_45170 [Roseiflexaceae bacterium]